MNVEEIVDNRTDLLTFIKTMFHARKNTPLKENYHQDILCEKLEKVVTGEINRLIINIPPRAGKTEIAVINFIAWCMGNFPDSEFIHASYSKRLATANTYAARAIMTHEKYKEIFGDIGLSDDSRAKDEFRTDYGGIVYATGAEGTITGYGAGKMRDYFGGCIIIDDPHKAGEANSDTMRNNVIDWFQTTMESRKNSNDTPIIIVMQRLHEDDLSGFLLNGGNGEEWDNICIPALDDNDESFWPEQFITENLIRLRDSNSYMFSGQFMQLPSPAGGGIFKTDWWKTYTNEALYFDYLNVYADTAMKTGQENDFSVFQCWGKIGNKIYLIDQVRGKWESPQLLTVALAFYNKYNTSQFNLRQMKVEDKSSGTGLVQQMRQAGLPVVGIQRDRDKVSRGYDVAPQIEVGNVYIPLNNEWISDYLHEFNMFPNGKHDDQVDPTMDAIQDMLIDSETKTVYVPTRKRR